MTFNIKLKIFVILLLTISVDLNLCVELTDLKDAGLRYARFRCLQQFPLADVVDYSDNHDTHCFLHCFLYKMGLMDLSTRGLNSEKFINIWDKIGIDFEEDTCLERFDFAEALNGNCTESYRKLMQLRSNCLELFEYTFSSNITWKSEDYTKPIGQSATEFCDYMDEESIFVKETSQDEEVSLLSQYKEKLKCIFNNIYYLDAYGRVDESEIIFSYQEALEDSAENRHIIHTCSHRANSKYQHNYFGNMVLQLQKCLKAQSAAFDKVFKLRDENSRQY